MNPILITGPYFYIVTAPEVSTDGCDSHLFFLQLDKSMVYTYWLVVSNMNVIFHFQKWDVIRNPTDFNSIIFQRGRSTKPPTRLLAYIQMDTLW